MLTPMFAGAAKAFSRVPMLSNALLLNASSPAAAHNKFSAKLARLVYNVIGIPLAASRGVDASPPVAPRAG